MSRSSGCWSAQGRETPKHERSAARAVSGRVVAAPASSDDQPQRSRAVSGREQRRTDQARRRNKAGFCGGGAGDGAGEFLAASCCSAGAPGAHLFLPLLSLTDLGRSILGGPVPICFCGFLKGNHHFPISVPVFIFFGSKVNGTQRKTTLVGKREGGTTHFVKSDACFFFLVVVRGSQRNPTLVRPY